MNKEQHGDPIRVHLQWFAGEGNPGQASGEGANAPESFVTDLAKDTTGSGAQPALQEGAQGKTTEPGKQQGAQATEPLPSWTSANSKELRSDPRFAAFASKFKTFDDAVKSALELESKAGSMVSVPSDKSTPEEVAAFYAKIGVPSKPEDYKFDRNPSLGKNDEAQEAEFKKICHANHIPQTAAAAIHKAIMDRAATEMQEFSARNVAAAKALESDLKKEWGNDYGANREILKRGISSYAPPGLLEAAARSGMGNNKDFAMLFYKLGLLTKEDSAARRGDAAHPTVGAKGALSYPGLT